MEHTSLLHTSWMLSLENARLMVCGVPPPARKLDIEWLPSSTETGQATCTNISMSDASEFPSFPT